MISIYLKNGFTIHLPTKTKDDYEYLLQELKSFKKFIFRDENDGIYCLKKKEVVFIEYRKEVVNVSAQ